MNKNAVNIFFILFIGLFLISASYASEDSQHDQSLSASENNNYLVSSDLSNDEIQTMFDNAKDGDTFEFTSKEYKNISLVVDKKLIINSKKDSVVYASPQVSDKAKDLGIDKTFGFYFTSNSAGSILSGITIKATDCDNAIIIDNAGDVIIKNNYIIGGKDGVLIKDSEKINLSSNKITQAFSNGLQLQNCKNIYISKNNIWDNVRSGIIASDIYDCEIINNTIHHNKFAGISLYGITSGSLIKNNVVHNNTNGIFINSRTTNDKVIANTFSHSRRDSDFELGSDESGNGLLFGDQFRTPNDGSKLLVKNNALIHNEQFQAKNNPANEKFGLDQNWFDSTDGESTFVCPMLFAKILRLDTITIKNGIGLQVTDENGNPVNEMGMFDVPVEVDGNKYTVTVQNDGTGELKSSKLQPDTEYQVDVTIGRDKKIVSYTAVSGPEKYEEPVTTDSNNNEGSNSQNNGQSSSDVVVENYGSSNGNGNGNGNGQGTGSSSSPYSNSKVAGNYGTNSSDVFYSSSSAVGDSPLSNGESNAGSSSEGASGESGVAYEISPESKVSKSVVDTSGVVILAIVSLVVMFVMGYRQKSEFE